MNQQHYINEQFVHTLMYPETRGSAYTAVATFGKILGNFSLIVPPSATGARLRRFRRWGLPVTRVGTF